jgi:hypothetical protein
MGKEVVCPHCGLRLPIDPLDEPLPALDAARTVETVIPRTVTTDEGGLPTATPGGSTPEVVKSGSANGHSSTEVRRLAARIAAPDGPKFPPLVTPDPDLKSGPGAELPREAFPSIQLDAPAPPAVAPAHQAEPLHDEPRTPWAWVLLGSYASAMTLACLWLVWQARRPEPPAADTIPSNSRPDLPSVNPAAPSAPIALPQDRITTLGQPLRRGAVELTPLEVRVGQVELAHVGVGGEADWRDGGPGALFLHIRLTNTSSDAAFAPLEAAFVREPDRGRPESFLESPTGERIDTYPLPQASEWTIVGQSFRELQPGESFETVLVSTAESAARFGPEMTWRVRLRTDPAPGRTEMVGVRIRSSEVQ